MAVQMGVGVGGQSPLCFWRWLVVGSLLMDVFRRPAAPRPAPEHPRGVGLSRRNAGNLREGAGGDGDGVKDVYSPADAVFGAANNLRQLPSGARTRHLKTLWVTGPGGCRNGRCEPQLRSGSRWASAPPLTHPGRVSAVAPTDPIALPATFVRTGS